MPLPESLALELAPGTGDLARAVLAEARVRGVVGADFVVTRSRRTYSRTGRPFVPFKSFWGIGT